MTWQLECHDPPPRYATLYHVCWFLPWNTFKVTCGEFLRWNSDPSLGSGKHLNLIGIDCKSVFWLINGHTVGDQDISRQSHFDFVGLDSVRFFIHFHIPHLNVWTQKFFQDDHPVSSYIGCGLDDNWEENMARSEFSKMMCFVPEVGQLHIILFRGWICFQNSSPHS